MLASMIDGLLADKKGILVAIATGNEGHRAATLKTSSTLKSIWKVPAYGRDNMFILGEKDGTYTLKLTLRNTKTGDEFFTQTFSTATEWTKSFRNFGTDDAAGAQLTASSMVNRRTGRHAVSLNLLYNTCCHWHNGFVASGQERSDRSRGKGVACQHIAVGQFHRHGSQQCIRERKARCTGWLEEYYQHSRNRNGINRLINLTIPLRYQDAHHHGKWRREYPTILCFGLVAQTGKWFFDAVRGSYTRHLCGANQREDHPIGEDKDLVIDVD